MGVARIVWSLVVLAAFVRSSPPALAWSAARPQSASVVPSGPTPYAGQDHDERPLPPGVYRAGKDVSLPKVVRHVEPWYTSEAMHHEIHGLVRLDCVVGADGTVGDVRIVRSLDRLYGLDEAAVAAAKQWTFEPGLKDGVAVPVMVTIDMAFVMDRPVQTNREKR